MKLNNIFPFLEWIPKLKNKDILRDDLIAGITVALILVPQSMAYAGLAGLPLEVGLYTAFIPVIIGALFGSSHQMSTGPVTIVSLMTATTLSMMPATSIEGYIVYASLLAFFIGLFYILLGILKLGIIVDFLSHPVITSFTNAVAIITITSQLSKIFGISVNKGGSYFYYIWLMIKEAFNGIHAATFILGIFSILLLVLLAKYARKIPRVLILLIISIGITSTLKYLDIDLGIEVVGQIKNDLPDFSIPFLSDYVIGGLSFNDIKELWIMSMIIGLIGFTESISVAKFVGTQTKQRVSANRELIGQGLANISSGLFGGFGVAGSFSKTAVNLRSGARTGLASVIAGLSVFITILFFTDLLYNLPKATLAAIIIVAVFNLIKIKPILKVWKIDKHEGIVAIITFILTLVLSPSVELGIIIGVVLSLGLFIYRSMRPRLSEISMYKDGVLRDNELFGLKDSKKVSILRFDGSLFFANAGYFESSILDHVAEKEKLKFIILDLELVNNIDYTGEEALRGLIKRLDKSGIKIYLTELRINVIEKLTRSSFIKKFGEKYIFTKVEDALEKIKKKHGKKADTKALEDYSPDKKKEPELEKKVIKKIEEVNKD